MMEPQSKNNTIRSRRARIIVSLLRGFLSVHLAVVWLLSRIGRTRTTGNRGADVLLTGTFYSDNWVLAHIRPMAMADNCHSVRIVTTHELQPFDNVRITIPSNWLRALVGDVAARLLVFAAIAVRRRPHFVGGFHLLFNGLIASIVARLCGARSIYFCVGGPAEIADGGLLSENRLFEKIETPDSVIEIKLIRSVKYCDQIITMGTSAKDFFVHNGVTKPVNVVSGGTAVPDRSALLSQRKYDVVFVGRLAPIKRLDIFVGMVDILRREHSKIRTAIVGDGAERENLERQAKQLGLERHVHFAGFQPDVSEWLREANIFVLTSDSEGLSLAMVEAMAWGVVPVVSDVGDLGDLVVTDESGQLVSGRSAESFAEVVTRLLSNPARMAKLQQAARQAAQTNSVEACASRWQNILQ